MHTLLFYAIVVLLFGETVWSLFLGELNRRSWTATVPPLLSDVYPQKQFERQKAYRRVNFRFGVISSFFNVFVLLVVLGFDGFAWLDHWILCITDHWLWRPLFFFGGIGLGSLLIGLPFSVYSTFGIEARFGFNNTTWGTFVLDTIKSILLGIIIGGGLLALLVWFYRWAGSLFWLYGWVGLSLFVVFFSKFYSSLILPLFNKLTPLEDGPLRRAIEEMSRKASFSIENIYVMDGSRRSTKANAFFSGFGRNKRIVLFDTLINDLSQTEVVAVLAHEIGHYQLKHVIKGTILGILQTGLMLFLLGWFVNAPALSMALGAPEASFHMGLLGFGLLYTPIGGLLGLGMTILSRKHEYQADAFAAQVADAGALQSALKKLSANALSNPTPHPWYVFFNYSHPPLLKRLEALGA